ncbi:MAG: DUF5684 domain-containing protein [Myxococcota bacterium]
MRGLPVPILVLALVVGVFTIACMWRIFTKAGKPGWAAIVPFYNVIVMIEISGRPMWNFAMLLVPFANIVFLFFIYIDFAKSYGKSAGFGVGLVFLTVIFAPMLAFGDAKYEGPAYRPS